MMVYIIDGSVAARFVVRSSMSCADRRPDDVVAGHKRRAVALWVLLIGLILACEQRFFAFRCRIRLVARAWYIIPGTP